MATASTQLKVHQDSRLSASLLARYLSRRNERARILRQSKYPPAELVLRYRPAKAAGKRYLVEGFRQQVLDDARQRQRTRHQGANSKWVRDDARQCMAVVDLLPAVCGQLPANCAYTAAAPRYQPKLNIQGVEVSVNVDVEVTRFSGVGAVMLVFGQDSPGLTMEYMAALVEMRVAVAGGKVDPDLCQVVNVRSGAIVTASQCSPQPGRNIHLGCRGIAQAWASI